jgi:hypothetical protein
LIGVCGKRGMPARRLSAAMTQRNPIAIAEARKNFRRGTVRVFRLNTPFGCTAVLSSRLQTAAPCFGH